MINYTKFMRYSDTLIFVEVIGLIISVYIAQQEV